MPKVKVTKQFNAVPDGAVYPEAFEAGAIVDGIVAEYALRNAWGVPAMDEDIAATDPPSAAGDDAETTESNPDPVRKAKVVKQGEFEGARYPKGVVVEDVALAERMVAAGFAAWLDDKPAPESNKSAGAAPQNK